ncbi:MAG: BrnT family toxin [Deltaproteobacteria bacterium]|nr:BrnT family toxin [Deltaproteobacteria bacterium]
MKFECNDKKSLENKLKHGIDFNEARDLWNDDNRVEIHATYPSEERYILIGKVGSKIWTAIFTLRGESVRIISVRRSRKKEVMLYEEKEYG